MLTCHEIIAFMPAELGQEILNDIFTEDKPFYRSVLATVAEARKVRPVFLDRQPRPQRQAAMLSTLSAPRMEDAAANLLRTWFLKTQSAMLGDFLDHLGIAHNAGVVETFPPEMDAARLKNAVDALLEKYPPARVAVYLNAFVATCDVQWPTLLGLLKEDGRLQLG